MPAFSQEELNSVTQQDDEGVDLEALDYGDEPASGGLGVAQDAPPDAPAAEPVAAPKAPQGEEEGAEGGEGEAKAEGEEQPPAAEAKERIRVPKSRLDSALARARRAEEALALRMKAEAEAQKDREPVDLDAQVAEQTRLFTEALADGDHEAAAKANRELLRLQAEAIRAEVSNRTSRVSEDTMDAMLTDELIDELVAANPELQPGTKTFDQELVNSLEELRTYYRDSKRMTDAAALAKAFEVRFPQGLKAREEQAQEAAPRENANLSRKLDAASRQPPRDMGRVGADNGAHGKTQALPDIDKLSDAELDALPESVWATLLGDEL